MLIAEIGNNFFGDMDSAKEHIKVARDCGADACKFQAFIPGDFEGSMPESFYKQCSLTFNQYMDLIDYGNYLKIPVFYSIFNISLLELDNFTEYSKLAAWQTNDLAPEILTELDDAYSIISINGECKHLPELEAAIVLYATEYNCTDPVLERIGIMQRFYKRAIGLSDHSVGIETCKEAIDLYQVPVIEKHFTLKKNMTYRGEIFRDTVHAADPTELKELSKYFKKQSYTGVECAAYGVQ